MVTTIVIVFVLGYLAITLENEIKVNKAAAALVTGVICWVAYIMDTPDKHLVNEQLLTHLADISSILFFLVGAMAIVEVVDTHDGFDLITDYIHQTKKRRLLWMVAFLTFFLSAMLDNLTTTIVMVSLLRKLISNREDRLYFVGITVIAANAGGAWTPIGDVTTTMLWIGGQISTVSIMSQLFLPSIISLVIPLIALSFYMKGDVEKREFGIVDKKMRLSRRKRAFMLVTGVLALISVPVFKLYTHLPPFMGMMLGLGVMWVITELIHRKAEDVQKEKMTLVGILHKIDISSILFFLGILLAVAAMEASEILPHAAQWLSDKIGDDSLIVMAIGLLSSIVDNVPLVAAAQGMYSMTQYPMDSFLWTFLAFSAGTGGSILIIGSAAGVAAMGLEKVDFFWYVKKISWLALLGFLAGSFSYILIDYLMY